MSPIPENLDPSASNKSLREGYAVAAKAHNAILTDHIAALSHITSLEKQLEWLQHRVFGTSSEKIHSEPMPMEQVDEVKNQGDITTQKENVPSLSPKPKSEPTKSRGHGWGELPADLPRIDVVQPITEEERELLAKGLLVKIRDEVTERLAVHPKTLYVKRFIRTVFARVDVDGSRTVLPLQPIDSPIEKGRADVSILAFLVVSKFIDHLPLDRIRKIFLRQGYPLATSTMATWLKDLHELLRPIYLAMVAEVTVTELKSGSLIHADETICRVVLEDKKHKTHHGYFWVYIGSGHIVYEYTHSRGSEHPSRILSEFHGTLQADGYAGYNAICKANSLVRAGCHSHARRKFVEALPKYPMVQEMLEMYGDLFAIEVACTKEKMSATQRLEVRTRRSESVFARMRIWAEAAEKSSLPKDPLGDAVGYILSQWEPLSVFLKDGRVPLDNNISERALRPVVLGRNNFLYFGSEDGAKRGATFYSLAQSCVALGINPTEYLEDILGRIDSHPNRRITELTPAGWRAARNQTNST